MAAGLALAGAVFASAAPAQARAVSPQASLQIRVTHQSGVPLPTNPSLSVSVTLTCDPDGGTHPTPEKACAELTEINGDLNRLATGGGHMFCLQYYDPVRVTITGYWYGEPKAFVHQYTNLSCLHAAVYPYTEIIPI
jgi:hypothetical protein